MPEGAVADWLPASDRSRRDDFGDGDDLPNSSELHKAFAAFNAPNNFHEFPVPFLQLCWKLGTKVNVCLLCRVRGLAPSCCTTRPS